MDDDIHVTSHGQTGGITAHIVNASMPPPTPHPPRKRKRWWQSWAATVLWIATVIGGVFAVLSYFDNHHPREEAMSNSKNTFVTSHNQSGGITAGTVNIGTPPARQMTQQMEAQLRQLVPTSNKVTVTAVMGDGEAFAFAQEITSWLRANGWAQVEGVNQAVFSQPVFNQSVDNSKPGEIGIIIGTRR
jgi:hypothetical protein